MTYKNAPRWLHPHSEDEHAMQFVFRKSSPSTYSQVRLQKRSRGASFGVERTVFLEQKACLLTIHADGAPRLWSTKKAEFLQKLAGASGGQP